MRHFKGWFILFRYLGRGVGVSSGGGGGGDIRMRRGLSVLSISTTWEGNMLDCAGLPDSQLASPGANTDINHGELYSAIVHSNSLQ